MKTNERGLVACEIIVSGVQGYNKGEIAGFAPDVAKALIAAKQAKEAPAAAAKPAKA